MNQIPLATLSNGVKIPQLGYGVAALAHDEIKSAVSCTAQEGYRFFDNAPFYNNEAEIAEALRESGIKREEFFISTKLPNDCHAYDDALKAFDKSMKAMKLDYMDMYMIHFPLPLRDRYCEAWKAMERLYEEGLVRVIGVSNFLESHLKRLLNKCNIKPIINELECNPYHSIQSLRRFCAGCDIRVINWFPLGGPAQPLVPYPIENYKVLLQDKVLGVIGAKYAKTPAQVALRWAIEADMTPIPKSASPKRIRENRNVFDFSLTPEEMKSINELDHGRRLGPDPDTFDADVE
ncbi:MAG: aldo/keto reductase [Clostridiales Family XIII bacterium]|jgi:diketogulonate reductase-like aldo/keto reductase|nr:aldo/keto reductase [Clostridiales Family XIII bacterium]